MSANPLFGFLGWTFIPGYATRFIHSLYYGLTIRAGDPRPQPGTPLYRKHYNRIYATLIIAYLSYTFIEVFHDLRLQSDYYTALGVPHNADEKLLRSRMRRLAAQYHPDKVGDSGPAHDYYVALSQAADVLMDPVRRFAYDRFGPEVIVRASGALGKQSQVRDWLTVAFMQSAPSYVGGFVMLIILGMTGYLQFGRFWRYLAFVSLTLIELWVWTRPVVPWFLWRVVNPFLTGYLGYPPLLSFQYLALARKMTFNLFIAISQLGPLFEPPGTKHQESGKEVELQQLAKLEHQVKMNELEAARLLALDMTPFVGDDAATRELKNSVKDWLVQNTIRSDPEVRQRVSSALESRQQDNNGR